MVGQGSTWSLIVGLYGIEDSKLARNVQLKSGADKQSGQSNGKGHLGLASSWSRSQNGEIPEIYTFLIHLCC